MPPVNLVASDINPEGKIRKGRSRLGGLSLNQIYGRGFIENLIASTGFSVDTIKGLIPGDPVVQAVEVVLAQIPQGFLPKKQIKQLLTAQRPFPIFGEEKDLDRSGGESSQLDYENFGNAISPALTELLYTDGDRESKYLASDSMNVYVRVPNTLEGGSVQFGLNGYEAAKGKQILPTEFQADTVPYTFKLEETLAATNLPAWPGSGLQIFKEVVLRYSQEGLDGEYISLQMDPYHEDKGVVWRGDVGIIPGRNVFYYFEVTLDEPVKLVDIVNPAALGAAILSPDGTHDKDAVKQYPMIESWAMPDPRNLQLQDRGIIKALFTPDVGLELFRILSTSTPGKNIPFHEYNKLTRLLGRNADNLLTQFEGNFDPMLASVFTVPAIDYKTESLWVAPIPAIDDSPDGKPHRFEAIVRNADGEDVDHIVVYFIGDSSAPEASIRIGPANAETSGYWNKDGIFVSTNKTSGPAVLLNIDSKLKPGTGMLGRDDGYLLYQVIDLDVNGQPMTTWLPLTVESSMLASDIWEIAKELLASSEDATVQTVLGLSLDSVLSFITPSVIQSLGNPVLAQLGIRPINAERSQFIADLLGALAEDIDTIPLTYDAERDMTMAFTKGEYGLRALGIDNLLNIGSHIAPTRLRIVAPEYDSSKITRARFSDNGGDINHNGKIDDYEKNIIYANAQELILTITVEDRTVHPGMITVQYENAEGEWITIGDPIELKEAEQPEGSVIPHTWKVRDFDDLVASGGSVKLRTITWNELDLTTMTPEADYFTIMLDNDVHPVEPKVLVVDLNDDSIVMTNPDSGAPQGTIELIGYTPRRTVPATKSIRVQAKRMNDDAWKDIGTVKLTEPTAGMSGTDTAAMTFNGKVLADVYVDDKLHIQDSGSYLKWIITVNTKDLDDTIEMDNLAAAHANSNLDGTSYAELDTNRYMVRAYAVGDDDSNISDAVQGEDYTDMFSVDNVDDVAPLGQNIIAVSQDDVEVTPNGDGSFTVGGLVDKYDPEVDSPIITLTITPGAKRSTYDSAHLFTSLPDGAFMGEVTETAENSGVYTVMVDVGTLMDDDEYVHNDRYLEDYYIENPDEYKYNPKGKVFSFTAYALTEDASTSRNRQEKDKVIKVDISETTAYEITVNVQNTYRHDPGVLAITVENSDGMVNPDSKAPKYELTFNAYAYGLTSPPTEAVRFEVKRPGDETWERITGTVESEMVTDADLDDIVTGLIQITEHNVLTDGDSAFAIPRSLMKFSVTVDTRDLAPPDRPDEAIKLEDTITRGDAAERYVVLDDNQYRVRAIALTPKNIAHPEYLQRDGVDAHFSLDNDDDVPPLGPTNITAVSDKDMYGDMQPVEANEDGSYTVGGIADEPGVNSPVAIFHIEPTAEEITYLGGSLQLVQTAPNGTETVAKGSLEDRYVEVDVGALDNGTYMYYALTVDEHGNVQVQGEKESPSPMITVHVNNFKRTDIETLVVTSVDGVTVDGELPERIPLRESISVSFNVPKGTLMVDDLTAVHVNGEQAAFTASSDAKNAFSLMASELSKIASGHYTVHGEVTKRNGSLTFPLAMVNLDNTAPMISFVTPTEGATVNDLPTLHAVYTDGEYGVGISLNTTMVRLARIRPDSDAQEEMDIPVNQNMVEQDIDSVVYTRIDKLAGGAYQYTVQVTDSLGNVGEASVNFAVEGVNPTVMITAPAPGQEFEASPASVTGFFAGGGDVGITKFTVNTVDILADVTVEGNSFTYMPADGFSENAHEVAIEVTDGSGLTAQTALTFTVAYPVPTATIATPTAGQIYNHGMPIITGTFSGADPVMGTVSLSDSDGNVISAMEVSGNAFEYTPAAALGHGSYTVSTMVTDVNGNTADASTKFSVDIPGPSVVIHAPAAGQVYDHGMPVITVESSGVAEPVSVSVMINGVAAVMNEDDDGTDILKQFILGGVGVVMNEDGTYSPAEALEDGEHTVVVTATDANGKTDEATVVFNVDIPGPSVVIHAPAAGQVYDHGMPVITVESSGVAEPVSVSVMINGVAAVMNEDDDGTDILKQFILGGVGVVMNEDGTYSPAEALEDGEHTVVVTATDANGKTDEATVVFNVDIPGPSVAILSPAPGQTYEHGEPVVRVEYSGMTEVNVTTLTVNGEDVEGVEPEDNAFEFTPTLGDGEYKVVVEVTDENDKTAKASVVFNVAIPKDTTPPVISEVSPSGLLRLSAADVINEKFGVTISAVISDEQSDIMSIEYAINKGALRPQPDAEQYQAYPADHVDGKFEISESFDLGTHHVSLRVESEGGVREFRWHFTLEADTSAPTITSITPSGTIHAGMPPISASAVDNSGVSEMTIVVMDSSGDKVAGDTTDDGDDVRLNQGVTRIDFHPETPLSEGTYTIEVRATDTYNNSSTASGVFTVDFDTAAPIITSSSPQNGARLMYKYNEVAKPIISITYGDAETGVNVDSVRLSIEGPGVDQVIDLADEEKSASQVVYIPPEGLTEAGQYTVILEVSDNANLQGNVSEESDAAREANRSVHKFSFFVEYLDKPVLMAPFNHPNPFAENTRISFGLNQMSVVSIVIYDSTLRPVRVLLDNELMSAGKYTGGNGIEWDGKTSSGESLARGIYYAQIVVTGSFEPEYAILKLALTGAK